MSNPYLLNNQINLLNRSWQFLALAHIMIYYSIVVWWQYLIYYANNCDGLTEELCHCIQISNIQQPVYQLYANYRISFNVPVLGWAYYNIEKSHLIDTSKIFSSKE